MSDIISDDDLPEGLDRSFTALCNAFAEFWPHAAARIKEQSPTDYEDMEKYLKMGGVIRAVFHFQPEPAIAFELIEHDGTPREFYRARGSRRAGRGLQ